MLTTSPFWPKKPSDAKSKAESYSDVKASSDKVACQATGYIFASVAGGRLLCLGLAGEM